MTDLDAVFPEGDDTLKRTIVYEHPYGTSERQILVSLYTDGSIEVAERPKAGLTWGPPWTTREVESWS